MKHFRVKEYLNGNETHEYLCVCLSLTSQETAGKPFKSLKHLSHGHQAAERQVWCIPCVLLCVWYECVSRCVNVSDCCKIRGMKQQCFSTFHKHICSNVHQVTEPNSS